MQNTPSYLEIGSQDAQVSSDFFATVFGWKYSKMSETSGWFQTPSIKAGLHFEEHTPQFYVFFSVADLDEAVQKVRAAGGEAQDPGLQEHGFGRFSNCKDPTGLVFGLHENT